MPLAYLPFFFREIDSLSLPHWEKHRHHAEVTRMMTEHPWLSDEGMYNDREYV